MRPWESVPRQAGQAARSAGGSGLWAGQQFVQSAPQVEVAVWSADLHR